MINSNKPFIFKYWEPEILTRAKTEEQHCTDGGTISFYEFHILDQIGGDFWSHKSQIFWQSLPQDHKGSIPTATMVSVLISFTMVLKCG